MISKYANYKSLAWFTVILFTSVYLMQVIINHYFFRTYAFDYALMNNAIWDFSHFQVNQNTIFIPPLNTFFQDHIAFTLIIILPLFWILSPVFGTYTLLIIQVLFISAGGIGVYKYIQSITKDKLISLFALIHYFILQGHFATLSADYHDIVVGSAVISWFIYFFSKGKFLPAILFFIFSMVSKENMPIWLIFITIVLIIQAKNKKSTITGLSLILFAVFYFIIVYWILIPHFEDPNRPNWVFRYKYFGNNFPEVLKYFLSHPFDTFLKLFYNHTGHELGSYVKLEYYIYFLVGGGWVLFRKPIVLLYFIPLIAQKMLMDPVSRWSLGAYHNVEIESIYTLGIFFVIATMNIQKTRRIIGSVVLVMTLIASINALNHRYTYWYHEEKENILSKKMYHTNFNIPEVNEALKMVPDDVPVCGTSTVIPHLSFRDKIYALPQILDAEYMVLLEDGNPYPMKMDDYNRLKQRYIDDENWSLIYEKPPLYILKKTEDIN